MKHLNGLAQAKSLHAAILFVKEKKEERHKHYKLLKLIINRKK